MLPIDEDEAYRANVERDNDLRYYAPQRERRPAERKLTPFQWAIAFIITLGIIAFVILALASGAP
jgi:hypothetical protein